MISPGQQHSITLFQTIAEQLATRLKPKTKAYFLPLILGVLLAFHRRRTVPQWIQAAQLSDDYRQVFYHMSHIGKDHQKLSDEMLKIITTQLAAIIATAATIRLVLDDSPTKRYGSKVEGAGFLTRSWCGFRVVPMPIPFAEAIATERTGHRAYS